MKVVVTRARGQEGELVAQLESLGHEVVHCPLVEVEPLGDEPIDASGYDWLVVTSVNGVSVTDAASLLHAVREQLQPAKRPKSLFVEYVLDGVKRAVEYRVL